jgi:superfamily II DNA or RNA helicase
MRLFSQSQKIFLYVYQQGKCASCQEHLNYVYEADHITPWAHGGKTIIENGQLLCKQCHKEKTKMQRQQQPIELREWQKEGITNFQRKLDSNENKMLAVATPGAGKTVFAAKCMEIFYL